MTTNQILLMQNRIAKLEAENAELKKTNLKQGFHIAELQGELDLARMNTREQIAALVKGLEWEEGGYATNKIGVYYLQNEGQRWFVEVMYHGDDYPSWSCDHVSSIEQARAAAEQHHRETVLSLLNL